MQLKSSLEDLTSFSLSLSHCSMTELEKEINHLRSGLKNVESVSTVIGLVFILIPSLSSLFLPIHTFSSFMTLFPFFSYFLSLVLFLLVSMIVFSIHSTSLPMVCGSGQFYFHSSQFRKYTKFQFHIFISEKH